jgi:hypothetical protein
VILGVDGYSDWNALHSGKHNEEVQLCAFDLLAMDGDDLRDLPLSMRKANLARLLARRPDGIFISDFEQGEIGPDLLRAACRMGLEGLVSKHRERPYRGGRQKHWIKIKTGHVGFNARSGYVAHTLALLSLRDQNAASSTVKTRPSLDWCHQRYFAAIATPTTATTANIPICAQKLFAKPPSLFPCIVMVFLPRDLP